MIICYVAYKFKITHLSLLEQYLTAQSYLTQEREQREGGKAQYTQVEKLLHKTTAAI